jgi:hypothetical protein
VLFGRATFRASAFAPTRGEKPPDPFPLRLLSLNYCDSIFLDLRTTALVLTGIARRTRVSSQEALRKAMEGSTSKEFVEEHVAVYSSV